MNMWDNAKNSISESVQEMLMEQVKSMFQPDSVKKFLASYADKAAADVRFMDAKADLAVAEAEEIRARLKMGDLNPPVSVNKKLLSAKTG